MLWYCLCASFVKHCDETWYSLDVEIIVEECYNVEVFANERYDVEVFIGECYDVEVFTGDYYNVEDSPMIAIMPRSNPASIII